MKIVRNSISSDISIGSSFLGRREGSQYMPELSKTINKQGTGYPYRATISHEDFAKGMEKIVKDIHYSNFKSEVEAKMGSERETIYHGVWHTLLKLEKERR